MIKQDVVVRFNDCDGLGHVNNVVYNTYFEEARKELFRIFIPDLDVRSWKLILASTRCDFLHEAFYAQTLTVFAWIGRLGTSSFEVEHAIQDEHGNWVARGKAIMLSYDFEEKKALPLTEEQRSELSRYLEGPADAPPLRS